MNRIFLKLYKRVFVFFMFIIVLNLGINLISGVSSGYTSALVTILSALPIINTIIILPYYVNVSKSRFQYFKDSTKFNLIMSLIVSFLSVPVISILNSIVLKTPIYLSNDLKNMVAIFLFAFSLTNIMSFVALVFRRFGWTYGVSSVLFLLSIIIYFAGIIWDTIYWKNQYLLGSVIFFIIGVIFLVASRYIIEKIEIR